MVYGSRSAEWQIPLAKIGGDLGVATAAEGSVHGAGMDGVRRDAAALEPSAQLPHEHDDGELGGGGNGDFT